MGEFDDDGRSLVDGLARDLAELKAENERLAGKVKELERENSALADLDDMATHRDRSYCQQIQSLQSQVEILKEVIEKALAR